jgi:hypothetical protein
MSRGITSKARLIAGITGVAIIFAVVIIQHSNNAHQANQQPAIPERPKPAISTSRQSPALPPLPPAARLSENLRPELRDALDPATPNIRRLDLIRAIPADLTEAETLALLHQLHTPPPPTNIPWHSTYIHLICNLLQQIPAFHDPFASALADIAANRNLPEVHRDYAFQHLRILWHRSRDQSTHPDNPEERHNLIEGTFRNLLNQNPETTAQSLLGLHEIRHPDGKHAINDDEITNLARATLIKQKNQTDIPVNARMTAIRIIAERRIADAEPILMDIAADDTQHNLVRAAAIGSLSLIEVHDVRKTLDFLNSIKLDHPVVQGAAIHTISSISK